MAITFAAGQRTTAAALNAFVPTLLQQGTTQTLNTTTLTNHNTFASISFGAGEIWEACVNLVIGDSTTASDIKTAWAVTGGLTTGFRHIVSMGVTATTSNDAGNINVQARLTTSSVSHGVTASAVTFATLQEKFLITTTTAGTLTLQWACVAASGNVDVKAGSHFVAHRLS